MRRIAVSPRSEWQRIVEGQGYRWHTEGGHFCWRESACYVLTSAGASLLRHTGNEVYPLLLQAAADVIKNKLLQRCGIAEAAGKLIQASWESGAAPLLGRFDFLIDEHGQPRLLEYNADGALTLLESAIIQRDWQRTSMPGEAQFNDLHELLVAGWKKSGIECIHLAWRPRHPEIEFTMRYLARTIRAAGLEAVLMAMHSMGYDPRTRGFVDGDRRAIKHCYKLYPWEWMLEEPFAAHLSHASTCFMEPVWAHLLGCKALLSVLWELFPDHPALLPCHDAPPASGTYVSKPVFGREGQNVSMHGVADPECTPGEFTGCPQVHQQYVHAQTHAGWLPQIGLWMVQGQAAGIGIREDTRRILHNDSTFVPHVLMD